MNKRKLLIALLVAGLFTAGLGAGVFPASADQRTYLVTLATGQTLTVTLDVPPGTPLSQIHPPGISTPIVSIQDITPAPSTAAATTSTTSGTSTTSTSTIPAPSTTAAGEPVIGRQKTQKTTGNKHRKAQPQAKTPAASLVATNGSSSGGNGAAQQ
ncbi:MAG: peptidoglycan DD-metalloendopeptidase family protein, partial [Solirubrobacteraceae bacterium]|nr:peptidoglycan DD-metalloendopeptidase family protein [Solirubrobacteraceae bacterium]